MIKSKSFYRVHLWTEIGWECLASLLVRTDIFCTSLWPQIFDSLLFMAIEGDTKQNSDIIGSRNIIRNADCLLVVLACLQHCASQQSQPNQIISAVLNDWVTIIRADIEDGALNKYVISTIPVTLKIVYFTFDVDSHFNRQTVFEVGAAAHFVQSFCSSNGLNINCLDPSSELFDTAMQYVDVQAN
jgi:hypothetical protein